jgi:hypothetical protein
MFVPERVKPDKWCCGSGYSQGRAEPTAEADRGRRPGFPRFNLVAGGPGSLALAFGAEEVSDDGG